ncbi:hypothetical protein BKA67DRAFT_661050 [Truncatella angustata]|uniref:Uncharacterized protein n=1 Tax=Truncatella angustata TaxID=152316 RepID=A0A9P8UHV2_9PEZI|nr:uncharacterized protein BKA67DRAFT_661050 [Truncatella angustata]KAH6652302.1 hypothetical protein BKA67DRAFT_661050 [Truncatella angustata]KAH8205103.1 hypothetical protein TruAng_000668 [Truncatella angustata]
MHFNALLLSALISGGAMANYNIKLYEHRNCLFKVAHECTNIAEKVCCNDDGEKFKSGKFEEVGGGKTTDNLKLYKEDDCGGFDVAQRTGGDCVSYKDKEIEGAKVFIVIEPGSKRDVEEKDDGPVKRVRPDTISLEEGRFKYSIKRDSPAGIAFGKLTQIEHKRDHLITFGKREEIPESQLE